MAPFVCSVNRRSLLDTLPPHFLEPVSRKIDSFLRDPYFLTCIQRESHGELFESHEAEALEPCQGPYVMDIEAVRVARGQKREPLLLKVGYVLTARHVPVPEKT